MTRRAAPTWPKLLRRDLAAIAVDMSVAQFERAVIAGDMPQPIMVGGEERWSMNAIEAAIGRLTGDPASDWERAQPGLSNAA